MPMLFGAGSIVLRHKCACTVKIAVSETVVAY